MSGLRECACPPCPGRGNDGHGLTHCAECCFGTGVEADLDCPIHGMPTADEPTALAGYIVAPDARGEQAIWRTDDELFPTVAITQTWLDPALWDVLVNAIEGGQS